MAGHSKWANRITSYNVCYTKLLRGMGGGMMNGATQGEAGTCAQNQQQRMDIMQQMMEQMLAQQNMIMQQHQPDE